MKDQYFNGNCMTLSTSRSHTLPFTTQCCLSDVKWKFMWRHRPQLYIISLKGDSWLLFMTLWKLRFRFQSSCLSNADGCVSYKPLFICRNFDINVFVVTSELLHFPSMYIIKICHGYTLYLYVYLEVVVKALHYIHDHPFRVMGVANWSRKHFIDWTMQMVSIFSDILPCDPIAEENIIYIWTHETIK